MKKNKNRKQREDFTIFDINQFEEEEDENEFMQIQLSSKAISINVFQFFKHSQFIRENYQKNTIKQEISNCIQQIRKKYNMKDESISLFFQMIQEGNAEFNSDYYYDLYKLSHFFKIKSIQKFLNNYSKSHSKNLDFVINLILTEEKEEIDNDDNKFDRIENLSIEMETYLSNNINKCLKNETFENLPISTIFRIIEKSDKNLISDESLLDFIIKSIDDRIVLFSLLDIKKLPKNKIDNLFKILTENHSLNYLPFDLEYVKSLINSNEEIETELENLKNENNKLKNENKKLEKQKNQLKKENEKLEIFEHQINELKEDNKNLENQINELKEENKNLEILENQLNDLKEENENRKKQIDMNKIFRSKVNLETQKNKTLQKQMDNINEEKNELVKEIDKLKQENENLENQLKILKEKREVTHDKKIKKEKNPPPSDEFKISDIISRSVGGDKHPKISFDDIFKPKKVSPISPHEFININFIFDGDFNGKKFYPIKENINLDSTVSDIQKMISKKCNISDELVVLKRKGETTKLLLYPSQKVRDIEENIKEKSASGKLLNIIYVEMQPVDLIQNIDSDNTIFSSLNPS